MRPGSQVARQESAKLLYVGSIPTLASDLPGWWNGLHARLKILWAQAHVGSSPTPGTNKNPPSGGNFICLIIGRLTFQDLYVCSFGAEFLRLQIGRKPDIYLVVSLFPVHSVFNRKNLISV